MLESDELNPRFRILVRNGVNKENIFNMQYNQYLPNITHRSIYVETEPPTRKRNLSLSVPQENTEVKIELESPCHRKQKGEALYGSRKNKVFNKNDKFKKRDLTKICQNNISEYMSLKRKVTNLQIFEQGSVLRNSKNNSNYQENRAKLSIKLLDPPLCTTPSNREEFFICKRLTKKSKTQSSPHRYLKSNQDNAQDMRRLHQFGSEIPITPKKYSQMSLKQIIEGNNGTGESQLCKRVKEFKLKIQERIKLTRRDSIEEPLEGW